MEARQFLAESKNLILKLPKINSGPAPKPKNSWCFPSSYKEDDKAILVFKLSPFTIGSEVYLKELSINLLSGCLILTGIFCSKE